MQLKTLTAKRVKTKDGFKTELYSESGELKATYPDHMPQPHGNKKTIIHNCFPYNIVFEKPPLSTRQKFNRFFWEGDNKSIAYIELKKCTDGSEFIFIDPETAEAKEILINSAKSLGFKIQENNLKGAHSFILM